MQLNGATTLMFESVPTFPDAGRYWDLVARHKVNLFYTAPTAIRTLMSFGVRSVIGSAKSVSCILLFDLIQPLTGRAG